MKTSSRLSALALIACLSVAGTAWAAPHGGEHGGGHARGAARAPMGRGLHEHAVAAHDWHQHHWHDNHVVYDNNYVTYAPPVVYNAPPADYETQPGLNLVFPLNIH